MRFAATLALLGFCLAAPAVQAESLFTFEEVAPGTAMPLTLTSNGLSATFGGGAAVCAASGISGDLFKGLTGNALMQGFCRPESNGPVTVNFSQTLAKISFAVAVNGAVVTPVLVTYLNHGVVVGSQTIVPVVPAADAMNPEASVSFAGSFDAVSLSSTGLLALDNLDATPAQ